jgi:hypothetical protein
MFEIYATPDERVAALASRRTLVIDDPVTGAVIGAVPLDDPPSPSLWRRMLARWTAAQDRGDPVAAGALYVPH